MRDYELVFIVSPQVVDENVQQTLDRVSQFITERGGQIVKVDPWGRRKLAYPINRFREGYYTLMQFKLDPKQSDELENSLRLSEDVIRHLLVRIGE
ncbi:MAG: 30S ribosomal protein S6 [Chloroflexi bacterium]|nr:30S ribosomal protein S6 [Chloroflexota bacterium]